MTIVDVRNLSFSYPGGRQVFSNVSFTLGRGELLLLLGPTGSGKTTLLLTLNGIIPDIIPGKLSGRVRVAGLDPGREGPARMALHVAYVFQDPESQAVGFTVEEEVAFGPENLGLPRDEVLRRVEWALGAVGLGELRDMPVDALSTGQRQKLALASALAMKPSLLVLDEPTSHLDPRSSAEFYRLVARLKGETSFIVVEHRLQHVLSLVDKVLLLAGGRVEYLGPPEGLRERQPLLKEYGVWLPEEWVPTEHGRAAEDGGRVLGETLVRVRDLWFGYLEGRPILKGVGLSARAGEVVAVLGPNGCGKTTLLKLVAGLYEPWGGSILVEGRPADPGLVSMVFQNPDIMFREPRVELDLASVLKGGVDEARRVLAKYGLNHVVGRSPFELSQGEKRLVSVVKALALGRRIVLMDEPAFGLDRKYGVMVARMIRRAAGEGRSVILVTHDVWLAMGVADRVVGMVGGKVVFSGEPWMLLSHRGAFELGFEPTPFLRRLVGSMGPRGAWQAYRRVVLG